MFRESLLISVIAIGLSAPAAVAQPKADAGSGPTTGAATANAPAAGPRRAPRLIRTQPLPAIQTVQPTIALALPPARNRPEGRSR